MSVDPMTMQSILQSIPEVNRRRRQAQMLRGVSDTFQNMAQQPTSGNYVPAQQGPWFPTVQKYIKDYGKIGNAISGAAGAYFGEKARAADEDLSNYTGDQSIQAIQQMSGGEGDTPTAMALRGYLGLLGGPDSKGLMSTMPRVQSTKVDENGNIIAIMSDNSVVDTGRKADYKTQNIETGDGRVVAVGTSGQGRGIAQQVKELLGIPMTQVTPEGGEPFNVEASMPNNQLEGLIAQTLGIPEGQPVPNYTTAPAGQQQVEQPVRVLTAQQKAAEQARGKAEAEAAAASMIAGTQGAIKMAEEQAKNTAAAQDALGSVENITGSMESAIDALINDPGLDDIIGSSLWARAPDKITGLVLPALKAGSPAANAYAKYQHLQGANFLQSFQSLKGGGQITEKEGEKAEQAFARLSRAQSPEEFRAALVELRDLARTIRERARSKAAGGAARPASPALPAGFSWED